MNLDAYTVRKLAPKLLIAVVAVNISIYLCVAAIDITNIFGRGINQLISAPFMEAADAKFELDTLQGPEDTLVFFGITIAVGMLLTFSLAGGQLLPMIGLIMLPIVLAVLAVLVTLVIRKALLVILTIISPIAFALWVLPGTDKYFKQWWSLFLKTLMVYPIVAALFAVTNIMAVVTFDSSEIRREEVIAAGEVNPGQAGGLGGDGFGDNALNAIIGVILVFIPLFMIPFAFKFAGGALGALSGKMSDLQKPISRMAGRSRQKRLEGNYGRAKDGQLFKAKTKPFRALNRAAQMGTLAPNTSMGKGYFKRLKNASSLGVVRKGRELRDKDEDFISRFGNDDDKLYAGARARVGDMDDINKQLKTRAGSRFNDDEAGITPEMKDARKQNRERAAAEIYDMQRDHGESFRYASATALHGVNTSYKARTGPDGKPIRGDTRAQMFETLDTIAGSDGTIYEQALMDSAQGADKANRKDLAPSVATAFEAGIAYRGGNKADIEKAEIDLIEKSRQKISNGAVAGLHDYGAEAAALDWQHGIEQDLKSGDKKKLGAAASDMFKLQQAAGYANNIVTDKIQDNVLGHGFETVMPSGSSVKASGIGIAEQLYKTDSGVRASVDERMKHYGSGAAADAADKGVEGKPPPMREG